MEIAKKAEAEFDLLTESILQQEAEQPNLFPEEAPPINKTIQAMKR